MEGAGWKLDKWGHLQKTLKFYNKERQLVPRDYRIKLQATSLRVEVRVHYPASGYNPARNEWMRQDGDYYSKIELLDGARLRIADDVERDDDYDVLPCYDEAFTLPRGRDGIYEITGVM